MAFRLHAWLCGFVVSLDMTIKLDCHTGHRTVKLQVDVLMYIDAWLYHGTTWNSAAILLCKHGCTTVQPYDYTWLYGDMIMSR